MCIAKLRWANRGKRSLLDRMAAADQDLIAALMRDSSSRCSDACISTLSRVMPRNSKCVERHLVFSSEKGTPDSWKRLLTVEVLQAGGDEGNVTYKKVL